MMHKYLRYISLSLSAFIGSLVMPVSSATTPVSVELHFEDGATQRLALARDLTTVIDPDGNIRFTTGSGHYTISAERLASWRYTSLPGESIDAGVDAAVIPLTEVSVNGSDVIVSCLSADSAVFMTDMAGRTRSPHTAGDRAIFAGIAPGVYVITIASSGHTNTLKLIVQ